MVEVVACAGELVGLHAEQLQVLHDDGLKIGRLLLRVCVVEPHDHFALPLAGEELVDGGSLGVTNVEVARCLGREASDNLALLRALEIKKFASRSHLLLGLRWHQPRAHRGKCRNTVARPEEPSHVANDAGLDASQGSIRLDSNVDGGVRQRWALSDQKSAQLKGGVECREFLRQHASLLRGSDPRGDSHPVIDLGGGERVIAAV
mmetsp:Transcript_31512/g.82679  ORF Transcript_31512/g.82679 Transcript_31512/m.82679 type:complete len:205 (+) Transcript_31512:1827-2441(+)